MFKANKVVCKLDGLGRVRLPRNLISQFKLKAGDCLEFLCSEDGIALQRYSPTCACCGRSEVLIRCVNNKNIWLCEDCIENQGEDLF